MSAAFDPKLLEQIAYGILNYEFDNMILNDGAQRELIEFPGIDFIPSDDMVSSYRSFVSTNAEIITSTTGIVFNSFSIAAVIHLYVNITHAQREAISDAARVFMERNDESARNFETWGHAFNRAFKPIFDLLPSKIEQQKNNTKEYVLRVYREYIRLTQEPNLTSEELEASAFRVKILREAWRELGPEMDLIDQASNMAPC